MRKEDFHDEVVFDRLADGELADAERRLLLSSLDEHPDGWRRCALAFLEAQALRREFRQLVRESPAVPRATDSASAARGGRPAVQRATAWLAIAASVLIAFVMGVMQREDAPAISTVRPETSEQLAVVTPPPDAAAPAPADDALTFWVRDDSGQTRPLRVPLVDAGALDRELGVEFQSALPAGIRERLQERGYDLQSQRRYAPLWLENGRRMIVPVEDTKIVPVGQSVY